MIKPESVQPILLVLAVLFAWASVWVCLSWLFARISGWTLLTSYYSTSKTIHGRWLYFQSAVMRYSFGFRATLNICANMRGLYISTYFPFNIFQPALLISWDDISGEEIKGGFWNWVVLRFKKVPTVPFKISVRLADSFEKTLNRMWHYDRL